MTRTARTRWWTRLPLSPGCGRVRVNRKKAPPAPARRCRSWCRASWSAQGPSCPPGDPCGAARASRPRKKTKENAAGSTASGTEDRRAQPAAPAILHPQDSAKSHKKRTRTAARASRPRACAKSRAAGSTAGLQTGATASGYGNLTRSRPQDGASNAGRSHQEPRKPLAGRAPNRPLWVDVRYRADCVRFTPSSRHSGHGWEGLKLTHSGSRGSPIRDRYIG